MTEARTLIVGGGISGLATAWWLARRGVAVELWEAERRPGGKIRSIREQGYLTERAAGLLVNFRPQVDQLIQEAGLAPLRRHRGESLNRYLVHGGRLARVPMRLPAMALSPLWSRSAKLRLLREILVPRGGSDAESVSAFIERRLGRELLETAIDPFVAGTLASDPDLASARAVLPRLTALERSYGSLTLGMLVNRLLKRRRANRADTCSFDGGMERLTTVLAATPGIRLRTGVRAEGVEPVAGGWRVWGRDADGAPHRCDAAQLVLSAPADAAGALVAPLDPELAALLRGIDYAPLAVLHLGLERERIPHPLDGSGFLVPRRERLGFNGNLWMSSLFDDRAPAGRVLLTSYLGGARDPARAEQPLQRLVADTLGELGRLLGGTGEPDYLRLERHPRALPLYHGDYPARTAAIRERLARHRGLHLAANYLDGVSVRERIYQGMRVADRIGQALAARAPESRPAAPGIAAGQPAGG